MLTPTEQRIAELATSGMTNREVAATLFVSLKTVEANLTQIYRKLGIRSRAQLAIKLRSGQSVGFTLITKRSITTYRLHHEHSCRHRHSVPGGVVSAEPHAQRPTISSPTSTRATADMSAEGSPVWLLMTLAVPTDEVLYGVFAADSPELVQAACARAGAVPERMSQDVDAGSRSTG